MNTTTCIFSALDTWFFRESRPHGSVGGTELSSLFPPPPRTVLGALRTLIGEQSTINWNALDTADEKIRQLIGADGSKGSISLSSIHLLWEKKPLFSTPLHLMKHEESFCYLTVGDPVRCDLGTIKLPKLVQKGAKTLEHTWLTLEAFEAVLKGDKPAPEGIKFRETILEEESRLGIARDNTKRVTEESLLYQTKHIRPKHELEVAVTAEGLPSNLLRHQNLIRFGGEGRLAQVRVEANTITLPKCPEHWQTKDGLILILISAALFPDVETAWKLGFEQHEENKCTVWKGSIENIPLTLHSAILSKSRREGGWDMKNKAPRARHSLIPEGSCWYVTVDSGHTKAAAQALHGKYIGEERELGRGRIVCGRWLNDQKN